MGLRSINDIIIIIIIIIIVIIFKRPIKLDAPSYPWPRQSFREIKATCAPD